MLENEFYDSAGSLYYTLVRIDNLGRGGGWKEKGVGGLREGSSDRHVHSQNVQKYQETAVGGCYVD